MGVPSRIQLQSVMGPGAIVIPKSMSVPLMVPMEVSAQKNSPGSLGITEKLGNGMEPRANRSQSSRCEAAVTV